MSKSKMTVAEAAEQFNISKEAIHNRIRRGTLQSVIENGVKYVLSDAVKVVQTPNYNDKYYNYIEEENARLKEKIDKLENETTHLRNQREQMLIDERDKIESIYKERDEQLKNVLHVVASKFLTQIGNSEQIIEDAISAEVIEVKEKKVEFEEVKNEEHPIRLKEYLKLKGVKKEKRKKITRKFEKKASKDARIQSIEGTIFLNPDEFDYEDMLS